MAYSRLVLPAVTCILLSACTSDRLVAPSLVSIAGATLRLETYLGRDFQPISPPDGKPLIAVLRVSTVDGAPVPTSVTADSAWVYNGALVWATSVVEEQARVAGASFFEVVARNGPKWGPGIRVDVVVRLRAESGQPVLLGARRQVIHRTD